MELPIGYKWGKSKVKIEKALNEKTEGHCPCRLERIPDNICPCKEFRETGICICNLFEKEQ